jgi:hypothetical protein
MIAALLAYLNAQPPNPAHIPLPMSVTMEAACQIPLNAVLEAVTFSPAGTDLVRILLNFAQFSQDVKTLPQRGVQMEIVLEP